MSISDFFKTERGFIVGVGALGGVLVGFGNDIDVATFWVTGTLLILASVVLAITAWAKYYDK